MNKEGNLSSLITAVMDDLKAREYSASIIRKHQDAYSRLKRYCSGTGVEMYSEEIGKLFVEYVQSYNRELSRGMIRHYERSIRRLDCALSGVEWYPEHRARHDYATSCYDDIVNEFEDYLYRSGKTIKRVRKITGMTAAFLLWLERRGCSQLKTITAEKIIEGFENATDKSGFRDTIGTFFQYAYNREMTAENLRHLIPTVVRHHRVPSVYSPEEVEWLLAAVDRSTVLGKRNYAIILAAARLGLRASDIARLKFGNLKNEEIEITQFKTKQPLTTVLTDELLAAINDYVDNGRPQSTDDHIFLEDGGYKPIEANAIYALTRRTFDRTDIDCGSRKRGPHSLRASLATALLAEGNDYPTIQRVLGQASIESTKSYAKADIDQLRNHAISVPPISGNLAALLSGEVYAL